MNHLSRNVPYYSPAPGYVTDSYGPEGDEVGFFELPMQEPLPLHPDDPLAQTADELVALAIESFQHEKHRSETRPRNSRSRRADRSRCSNRGDPGRQFACPFYLRRPADHMQCFTNFEFRAIKDVKKHVWNNHRLPPYCPICGRIFSTAASCDSHIRYRGCTLQDFIKPEGITVQQAQQLAEPADARMHEDLQWLSIWAVVFPGESYPTEMYPSGSMETAVCAFRNYWAANGERTVSEFLQGRGFHRYTLPDERRSFKALCKTVLRRVIDYLVENLAHEDSDASVGGPSTS
ncbi:uncharacterized protein F4812DRAFT_465717 [Daldinia caldariorum]|uniref:uncharacterized protein n=1 Tax=Daldinia caldariorum TaxID=326644 RepID=UPI002008EAE2|nr:uncharacterized protein F4812DRAFT_465717 [Daldinia caldariorum]KAI1466458.1 hypothetical protein F4812DRAFT_465717 [Daldinia caldariorum]